MVDRANSYTQDNARYATYLARDILTEVLPYLNIFMTEPLTNDEKQELENMNETTFNEISVFARENSIETKEDPVHNSVVFQVGPLAGQYISVHLFSMDVDALGIKDANVSNEENASNSIQAFDDAETYVHLKRSYYGAIEGRLGHAMDQVNDYSYNITNAESRIRDTDMGDTAVKYAASSILMQSGVSMMVQANQSTRGVMTLLGWK